MGNFKVTATHPVGEADTRESARELAETVLDEFPEAEVTIREATGASADEKMTRAGETPEAAKERKAKPKEPTRKK